MNESIISENLTGIFEKKKIEKKVFLLLELLKVNKTYIPLLKKKINPSRHDFISCQSLLPVHFPKLLGSSRLWAVARHYIIFYINNLTSWHLPVQSEK